MNDLGNLAYKILKYEFKEDAQRFPISYISGWLDAHVGELNTILHQDFYIDETGAFQPRSLTTQEEHILGTLYEIHYYEKASREVLRTSVFPTASERSDDWIMLKEGDTTIQRSSKTSISSAFASFSKEARTKLNDLVYQYNMSLSAPIQVAGEDGVDVYPYDSINTNYIRE